MVWHHSFFSCSHVLPTWFWQNHAFMKEYAEVIAFVTTMSILNVEIYLQILMEEFNWRLKVVKLRCCKKYFYRFSLFYYTAIFKTQGEERRGTARGMSEETTRGMRLGTLRGMPQGTPQVTSWGMLPEILRGMCRWIRKVSTNAVDYLVAITWNLFLIRLRWFLTL